MSEILDQRTITILRNEFGDTNKAFSDTVLQEIWDLTDGASSIHLHIEAALAVMFRRARNAAASLHDYKQGVDEHKMRQVFLNYDKLYESYKPSLEQVIATSTLDMIIADLAYQHDLLEDEKPVPNEIRGY